MKKTSPTKAIVNTLAAMLMYSSASAATYTIEFSSTELSAQDRFGEVVLPNAAADNALTADEVFSGVLTFNTDEGNDDLRSSSGGFGFDFDETISITRASTGETVNSTDVVEAQLSYGRSSDGQIRLTVFHSLASSDTGAWFYLVADSPVNETPLTFDDVMALILRPDANLLASSYWIIPDDEPFLGIEDADLAEPNGSLDIFVSHEITATTISGDVSLSSETPPQSSPIETPAPVPLPATGLLLLTAIFGTSVSRTPRT